ncbi:MAG: Na+/H+ antiporter [Verrucomicrobia bacterium]|nr:Na+/H+ antiporter [Verrucomicrobiota bacterium]
MSAVETVETILALLVAVALLTTVATRLNVPFPLVLTLGGLGLALVPGLPKVQLSPEIVFLVFLPPVLYGAAWFTSWRDFRRNLRPILMLAFGLTAFTTVVIGYLAHWIIPGLPLAAGFVLGAIISPPDAASATAIAQRLGLPKRIVTVLEGESLVNDAMGLVLYKFAVAAVVTGTFSFPTACGSFVYIALGGVVAGLVLAWLAGQLHCRLAGDPAVEVLFTFLTAYAVYAAAEAIHVSGVLATVVAGLYAGWQGPERLNAQTRIQGRAVWDVYLFLLNGLIFILIGLALRSVKDGMMGVGHSWGEVVWLGCVISAAAIMVRMAWIFPSAWLPRVVVPGLAKRDPLPSWRVLAVIGWTGMRGIVTLAAALALPVTTKTGEPFPHRDLIIFLSFSVILATLVLQGFSLPWLIRKLGLQDDGEAEREEHLARVHAARAAIADLERVANEDAGDKAPSALVESFRTRYQQKVDDLLREEFNETQGTEGAEGGGGQGSSYLPMYCWISRLRRAGLNAERREIIRLRKDGQISDEVLHKIERELDLEESRLA